jgi:hypothetical protein
MSRDHASAEDRRIILHCRIEYLAGSGSRPLGPAVAWGSLALSGRRR